MKEEKRFRIMSPSFFIGKQGGKVISFGSGQPDLAPPEEAYMALPDAREFRYGLVQGQEKLRVALSHEYPKSDANNFVITNGASEALDLALRVIGIAAKKKKILIPRPYYYSYPFIAEFAGLEPVYTDLNKGKIDVADFKKKIKGCAALLLNSPSNPTGRIESIETLKIIEQLSEKHGFHVVSDEVYKDLIYERENYLIKGRRVVTINSFSKTYGMCGYRIGYLYSPDRKFVEKVIEMKTHTSMNTNLAAQEMAYAALRSPRKYVDDHVKIWKERRDTIYEGLLGLGFDVWKPEGAFYVFPAIKNSNKVVNDLYYDHNVIVYDGTWFGAPGRIRLSYALNVDKIEEGLRRIKTYLDLHKGLLNPSKK